MLPAYLTKKEDSPSKRGYKQEIIATKTLASGRFFDKADINLHTKDDDYKIDVKSANKSYTMSLKGIRKLYEDCAPKTPALMIYLGDEFIIEAIIKRK
jgi:hypothetical protein